MLKKLPLLFVLVLCARYATAQSADAQIRAVRAASNEAIARHDAGGIVRNMLPGKIGPHRKFIVAAF
jgi:hypothetical protein